jgi:hypothetical protein
MDIPGDIGHAIVVDGYTATDDPEDPMLSYHDPATGSTGTISFGDLEDAVKGGYAVEITGINMDHPPAW